MMLNAGVEADAISYNIMIKECSETHDVARTKYMLSKRGSRNLMTARFISQ